MAYDINGRPVEPCDPLGWRLPLAVLLAAALLLALAGLAGCPGEQGGSDEPEAQEPEARVALIDTSDARAMHELGIPTETDVIGWHVYGKWGFGRMEDGIYVTHIWEDLPGDDGAWDGLYGIDTDNEAFRFPIEEE